jgi:hypothetical protein
MGFDCCGCPVQLRLELTRFRLKVGLPEKETAESAVWDKLEAACAPSVVSKDRETQLEIASNANRFFFMEISQPS